MIILRVYNPLYWHYQKCVQCTFSFFPLLSLGLKNPGLSSGELWMTIN